MFGGRRPQQKVMFPATTQGPQGKGRNMNGEASTKLDIETAAAAHALPELGDGVDYATGEFSGEGDTSIFYQRWLPRRTSLRGVVVVVHGLGEHGGRYLNLVRRLLPEGYGLYASDHRGFGRSGGERGHITHFREYLLDLRQTVGLARAAHPDVPLTMFAHSMGGLIGVRYLQTFGDTVDQAILCAPALGLRTDRASKGLLLLLRIMSRVQPAYRVDNQGSEPVSRDPEVVAAFEVDPFNNPWVTARWATEMMAAQTHWPQEMARLRMPLLIVQGLADRLVIPELTQSFFRDLPAEDKTLYLYAEHYHELINDLDREIPLDDIAHWLMERS